MTRVIVAGALANKPGNSGEAWVRTNWVRGLRRFGLEVLFVERLDPAAWGAAVTGCTLWFERVVEAFGLASRSVLMDDAMQVLAGDGAILADALDGADLLVNISGHLRSGPIVGQCRRRAYVDLDPGYTQVWHDQGAALGLGDHDAHFSVGLNLGRPRCTVPTGGLVWQPVLPPVLLDDWIPDAGDELDRFTSVASWRGGSGVVHHDGVALGPKAHAFRRLLALPARLGAGVELALEIDPADGPDRRALLDHGWTLLDPGAVAGDPHRYREFVRRSPAELSVAQPIYVHARTGWFSDRTAHYLAAGRPALVQDTGLPLPTGEGLVCFATLDEAAAGARRMAGAYAEHRAAARRFAEEHLDAGLVLGRFLDRALGPAPGRPARSRMTAR